MDHECNAYCKPEEGMHCCIIYAEPQWTPEIITTELEAIRSIKVLDIEPAREAPSIQDVWNQYEDVRSGTRAYIATQATKAWLLRWQDDLTVAH